MATETIIRLLDDLDGSDAERTVTFSWDGRRYEIDLSKKNIAAFEKTLKPYLAAARSARAVNSSRPSASGRSATRRPQRSHELQTIREWARSNGHDVSDRGRVPVAIEEAFRAAQ